MEKELVFFKGTKQGVQIVLDDEKEFANILKRLKEKLETGAIFFVGSQVTVNLGRRELKKEEYEELKDIISNQSGLTFLGIEAKPEEFLNKREEIDEKQDSIEKETTVTPISRTANDENVILIKKTIRSGQAIDHPGSVVILGDVNPGAEIKAHSDIVILGALRGDVHAGINGNKKAVVAALRMQCHQIRIAQFVIPLPRRQDYRPEIAYIEKDKIIVAPLETGAYKLEI